MTVAHSSEPRSLTDGPVSGDARSLRSLVRYAMVAMLAAEIAFFCLVSPDEFATAANLRTTLETQAVLGMLTVAMLLPLIVGEFDVSLATVFATAMVVTAWLATDHGVPILVATVIALIVATAVGFLNGLLVIATGANSLVVTLGTLTVLRGVTEAITQGGTITVVGEVGAGLRRLTEPSPLGLPIPVVYLAILGLLVWYLTEHTSVGRYWHAVGGSADGARLAGLRVNRLKIGAFALGGLLAGMAGVVQLAKTGTAGASLGGGFLFPTLAAAFLGAAAFRLGAFNVRGSITAILVLAVGVTGIRMSGAPLWIDEVFNGAALIVAVAIVRLLRGDES
jgi:ribose transport system permease protein